MVDAQQLRSRSRVAVFLSGPLVEGADGFDFRFVRFQHGLQIGDGKSVRYIAAYIAQLDVATRGAGYSRQAYQQSEATAVDERHLAQMQNELPVRIDPL